LTASGIVSLLFCGITLKHYAYYNMSRRTQLTTKYLFQVMAQLTENFIFIYLGLDLFVDGKLTFNPLFILVAILGICVARYLSVFPLSKAINWFIRYRAKRRGKDVADELPFAYQAMLFWAGLRGAVGVALSASLSGANSSVLRATVLVVVVLTVIIFGGTTARMLDILGIRTGVVEEIDSDDEFDIEVTHGGTYYKRSSTGLGYTPRRGDYTIPLDNIEDGQESHTAGADGFSSGNNRRRSPSEPHLAGNGAAARRSSQKGRRAQRDRSFMRTLLGGGPGSRSDSSISGGDDAGSGLRRSRRKPKEGEEGEPTNRDGIEDFDLDVDGLSDDDLPPAASSSHLHRSPSHPSPAPTPQSASNSPARRPPESGQQRGPLSARSALRELFSGGPTGDHAAWFQQLDEDFIKPKLLLDQSNHKGPGAV
jgi:hypothetical protein